MALETNIETIETLAAERWADNWNFRAYLRQTQESKDIDSVVHRLNDEIAAKIDCTKCANCCRTVSPSLTELDVARAATALQITQTDFSKRFLKVNDTGESSFRKTPCPQLKGTMCGIYANRPTDCSSYPHLHEPNFIEFSIPTIENYRVCPIVFNVYERLKKEFTYEPGTDYIGNENQEDS